ncbi:hypothetical protein BGZ67_010584, partial [Mortierella alpina]
MTGNSFDVALTHKADQKHLSIPDIQYTGTDERRQLSVAEYGYTWARCVFPQLDDLTQRLIGAGYEFVKSAYMNHPYTTHPDITKTTTSMRDAILSDISKHGYDPQAAAYRYCLDERCLRVTNWFNSRTLGADHVAQILANKGHTIHECVAGIATGRTASLLASAVHEGIKGACAERVNRLLNRQDYLYAFGHLIGNTVDFYERPGLLDTMAHCEETCTCTQALEQVTSYLQVDEAPVVAQTLPSFLTGNELALAWRVARGLDPSAATNRDVAVAFVAAGASGIDTGDDDEDALVAILVAKHLRDGTSDLHFCTSCCDDIMSEHNPHRENINAMLSLDPADMSKEGLMVRA